MFSLQKEKTWVFYLLSYVQLPCDAHYLKKKEVDEIKKNKIQQPEIIVFNHISVDIQ